MSGGSRTDEPPPPDDSFGSPGRKISHWPPEGIVARFLSGAKWVLIGAVVARAVSLGGTILATRLLAPRLFGQLSIIQFTLSFFTGVAGLGLGVAVTKRVAETRSTSLPQAGRFIGLAIWVTLLSGCVVTGTVLVLRGWLTGEVLRSPALAIPLEVSAVVVLFSALSVVEVGVLTGLEAFRSVALAGSVRSVLTSALLVGGVLLGGLTGALAGWAIGEFLSAMWALVAVRRQSLLSGIRISYRSSAEVWPAMRNVGLPALAANVAVTLALVMGQRILAARPFGFQYVAEFNVAYRWSLAVLFIPASVAPVVLPLLSNLRAANASSSFRRLFRINLGLSLLLTSLPALVLILARHFVLGLSGSFYAAEPAAFVILVTATIPTALNSTLSQAALSLDAVREWLMSDLVLASTMIAIALGLIPQHHAAGLAVAYLIGYVATCLVLVLPVNSRLRRLGVPSGG